MRNEWDRFGRIGDTQTAHGLERANRLVDDGTRPAIVRATALRLLAGSQRESGRALVRATHDADPLVRMAAAGASRMLEPERRVAAVRPLLRDPLRAVRIEAARALAATPRELWPPGERAALAAVLDEYRDAQHRNAERPEAHTNLGGLSAELGQLDTARSAYARALELDPTWIPAYVNLADVERIAGRDAQAEQVLRRGVEVAPGSADLRLALGLTLARLGRPDEAARTLAEAAERAPERARFAYAHGLALRSAGREEDALRVLDRAHRAHPGDRDLLVALATINRDLARRERALAYARKLLALSPDDPRAAALVRELESGS